MERLRQRADFLAAASGAKAPLRASCCRRASAAISGSARVGFTVSKKVGNAVERNRVRRRLREVVRLSAAERMRAGHDYVLVGRRAALDLPFDRLIDDMSRRARAACAPRAAANDTATIGARAIDARR